MENTFGNPNAFYILKRNPEKIYWPNFSSNPNTDAMYLIENMIEYHYNHKKENVQVNNEDDGDDDDDEYDEYVKYDGIWYILSFNPNAIRILERYFDKIVWSEFSKNPNPIHILEKYLDKVS